ncbi:putative DD34D transposase [Trichonephila clavipes]|nr:putative DD34D transposase [Trichonephila clavipes]
MQKKKVLFHQDNAPCHKSKKSMIKLKELRTLPPYSPETTPSDHWLFADLKRMLQGKRFCSNEEVIAQAEAILRAKTNRSTKKVFKKLKDRWIECITLEREYLDK